MSFITRTVASTVIFVTLGLASVSAPGLAYDLDRPSIATPALTMPTPAPAQTSLADPNVLPDPSTLPADG